jgi:hypothetical protein
MDVRPTARFDIATVYPGIDYFFHGERQQFEYDLALASQADPKAIRLAFDGARRKRPGKHIAAAVQDIRTIEQ